MVAVHVRLLLCCCPSGASSLFPSGGFGLLTTSLSSQRNDFTTLTTSRLFITSKHNHYLTSWHRGLAKAHTITWLFTCVCLSLCLSCSGYDEYTGGRQRDLGGFPSVATVTIFLLFPFSYNGNLQDWHEYSLLTKNLCLQIAGTRPPFPIDALLPCTAHGSGRFRTPLRPLSAPRTPCVARGREIPLPGTDSRYHSFS